MEQSYINFSPTIRLRNTNDKSYILCVKNKGGTNGLSRDEFETEISKEDYEKLLEKCNSLLLENFELKQKTHL